MNNLAPKQHLLKKWATCFVLILLIFPALHGSAASYSGTYSVGSTGYFKTISIALDSLETSGINGSVVLKLQAQSFSEQVEISAIPGASSANTITLKGVGNNSKIVYASTSSSQPIVNINGAKHIIIDSLMIESTGNFGVGINLMNSADSNVIRNTYILLSSTSSTFASTGIANYSTLGGTGSELIKNLDISNNHIVGGYFGIRLTNGTSSPNYCTIQNNEIYDFGRYGQELSGSIEMRIIGNVVSSDETTAASAIKMWPTAHSIEILNNQLSLGSDENHTRVLQLANAPGGGGTSWSDQVLVANNTVNYRGNYTSNMTGIYTKHVNYLAVYNNTVVMDTGNGGKSLWFDALNSTGNIISKNNNLVNYVSNGITLFVHGSVSLELDHNNFYNPAGFNLKYHGTTYTSLSTYQNARSQDLNSVAINPRFISKTDYHIDPANSDFDNLGEYLSDVSEDIDGDTRSSTHPDIGSDEYSSSADISITRFDLPTNCRNTSPFVSIDVWVRNLDSNDISSFTISYSLNGGTAVTETYSGTLAGNDSAIYSFSKSAVMTNTGVYALAAYTSLLADEKFLNDTATMQIAVTDLRLNMADSLGGCTGDNIVIDPGTFSGVSFLWSDNSTDKTLVLNESKAGGRSSFHWVKITDALGCSIVDTFKIVFSDSLTQSLGSDTSLCPSETLLLSINHPDASFLWHEGSTSNQLLADQEGWYSVVISAGFQCSTTDSIYIHYRESPDLDIGGNASICHRDSLILNASNAFKSYRWQDNSSYSTLNAMMEGLYWVSVVDSFGCTATDSMRLTLKEGPSVSMGNDTSLCVGDTLFINVSSFGLSYVWQDGSTSSQYNATTQGGYSVTVSNAVECTAKDSLFLTIKALPVVDLDNDTTICEGNSVQFDVTTVGATYRWQDESDQPVYRANSNGRYTVLLTDSNGCANSASMNLEVLPAPKIELGNDTTLFHNALKFNVFRLSAQEGLTSYLWSTSNTGHFIDIDESYALGAHTIWLRVEDEKGCTNTDTIELTIEETNSVFDKFFEKVTIYPNPSLGKFVVRNNNLGTFDLEVYDINGTFLSATKNVHNGSIIELSSHPAGVFLVRMRRGSSTRFMRLIVSE
ncbi:MAG: hypothetical protein ACI8ZN_002339 [Bacteroidia bacterium]|jgi:hypothetical protein